MICKMCIDDFSVFGDTNVEFISRWRSAFIKRLRKHTLYLKINDFFHFYCEPLIRHRISEDFSQ